MFFFLRRDRKGTNLNWSGGGEERGRLEGGESIFRIHYVIQEIHFQLQEKINKHEFQTNSFIFYFLREIT